MRTPHTAQRHYTPADLEQDLQQDRDDRLAIGKQWTPRHGIMFWSVMVVSIAIVVTGILLLALTALGQPAFGQEASVQGTAEALVMPAAPTAATMAATKVATLRPASEFDWKGLLGTLFPALWACMGPLVMAFVTKNVNWFAGAYIPRPMQAALSAILGAASASMMDGGTTVAMTAMAGVATQVYAGANPEKLLTTARPTDGAPQ